MTAPRLLSDRYELGPALGYGGMSEVHGGRDVRLGRDVALADRFRHRLDHRRLRRLARVDAVDVGGQLVAVDEDPLGQTDHGWGGDPDLGGELGGTDRAVCEVGPQPDFLGRVQFAALEQGCKIDKVLTGWHVKFFDFGDLRSEKPFSVFVMPELGGDFNRGGACASIFFYFLDGMSPEVSIRDFWARSFLSPESTTTVCVCWR